MAQITKSPNLKAPSINSYSAIGAKSTTKISMPKSMLTQKNNKDDLIKEAYHYNLNNLRLNLAVTKTRGLIRGGGKKPWRQKGTGRARFGSSRNPIWRGGGIVFGPTGNENYQTKLNKKARILALKLALAGEAYESNISIIADIKLKTVSSKDLSKLLVKLGLSRNILIVISEDNTNLVLSARNNPYLKIVKYSALNVNDLLDSDHILFTSDAFNQTMNWLSSEVSNTKDVQ